MRFVSFLRFCITILFYQCSSIVSAQTNTISKIAFGSCSNQNHPLPIFDVVVKHEPNLFVFLGDNIYADSWSMATIKRKYQQLADKPTFQNLKAHVPLIATWDDHDFGQNDGGKQYPFKKQTKKIFLDFFNEPDSSDRWKHDGVYTSYMYDFNGKKLQIILLDNRTFRDNLKTYKGEKKNDKRYTYKLDYSPHTDTNKTMLGKVQWAWLEQELMKPADIRLIGTGSQFGIEFNGYEAWANFPHEQQKMIDLIKKTRASGVLFLTGDVHYAEISRLIYPDLYPIYDVTASGLSSKWDFATPNKNRVDGPVMENHFGMISINWDLPVPAIKMEIWDDQNKKRIEREISLDDIRFH